MIQVGKGGSVVRGHTGLKFCIFDIYIYIMGASQ